MMLLQIKSWQSLRIQISCSEVSERYFSLMCIKEKEDIRAIYTESKRMLKQGNRDNAW